MKYLVRLFVVTFLFIVSTHAFAEQKIVVLDLKYVLNNSKAGKGAQVFLKKLFNDNAKKFLKQEKELKKEEADLLGKKTILSKEDYKKKGETLRKRVIDYQANRRKSLDEITTKRAKSREKLISKIEPIVDDYIKTNSISIVLDKKNMIGGLNEYDITKDIIEQLDKELPSLNLK